MVVSSHLTNMVYYTKNMTQSDQKIHSGWIEDFLLNNMARDEGAEVIVFIRCWISWVANTKFNLVVLIFHIRWAIIPSWSRHCVFAKTNLERPSFWCKCYLSVCDWMNVVGIRLPHLKTVNKSADVYAKHWQTHAAFQKCKFTNHKSQITKHMQITNHA